MSITRNLRNIVCNVLGESFWGFQAGLITPAVFLTVLLKEYDASATMIGSISAIENGGYMIPQVIGLYLFTSTRKRKRDVLVWHLLGAIPFLLGMGLLVLLGSGHLPVAVFRYLLLTLFALFCSGLGVIIAVWSDWIASLFDVRIRGRSMGLATFAYATTGALGGLLAGWLLTVRPGTQMYAILLLVASGFTVVSMMAFSLIDDPATQRPEEGSCFDASRLWCRIRQSMADDNFRNLLAGRGLSTLGLAVLPFIAVYFGTAEGGMLPGGILVCCGAAMTAGMAMGNLGLGWLGDRHGHKLGLVIGAIAQATGILILLLGRGLIPCIVVFACVGVGVASGWVPHYNLLFETCTHDYRVAHVMLGNLFMGMVAILAPLMAGVTAQQWGLRVVFLMALALSGIALLWIVFRVRDPRERRP